MTILKKILQKLQQLHNRLDHFFYRHMCGGAIVEGDPPEDMRAYIKMLEAVNRRLDWEEEQQKWIG